MHTSLHGGGVPPAHLRRGRSMPEAYRSAGLYLDAALWHQEHRLRSPVSADLRRAARSITKAALRGLPGSRLKQAFDLADLATLVEHDAVAGSLDMDTLPHAVDVVVVSTWFMLQRNRDRRGAGQGHRDHRGDCVPGYTTPQDGARRPVGAHPPIIPVRVQHGSAAAVPQVRRRPTLSPPCPVRAGCTSLPRCWRAAEN